MMGILISRPKSLNPKPMPLKGGGLLIKESTLVAFWAFKMTTALAVGARA